MDIRIGSRPQLFLYLCDNLANHQQRYGRHLKLAPDELLERNVKAGQQYNRRVKIVGRTSQEELLVVHDRIQD